MDDWGRFGFLEVFVVNGENQERLYVLCDRQFTWWQLCDVEKKKKTNSTFQLMGYVSPCLSNMLFAYMIIGNVHVNDTR